MLEYLFPEQEIPNREVAATAMQFRQAANLLHKDILATQLFIPFNSNCAFALELYLKSLNTKNVYIPDPEAIPGSCYMVFSQPNKRGHKLTEQYDELMPELQAELEKAYAKAPVVRGAPTVREALAAHDDLFVSSRYWFDPKYPRGTTGPSVAALIGLVNAIGDCVEKIPGWIIRRGDSPRKDGADDQLGVGDRHEVGHERRVEASSSRSA